MNVRPAATLSVDLDDLWAYRRTRGDVAWADSASLLPLAVSRLLEALPADLALTAFVVGRDAASPALADPLAALAAAGHEIANHSWAHRADFHRLDPAAVAADLDRAGRAIAETTGCRPRGFRGPSFRLSAAAVDALIAADYAYDASTFPTIAGPAARAWHFASADLDPAARASQRDLFGSVADGFRPLRPYAWRTEVGRLLEIPVTTLPLLRLPFHLTYVNFLADRSERLASAWFRAGLRLCAARGVAPSVLLHATDFIGSDDAVCPAFLPGMKRPAAAKLALLRGLLAALRRRFEVMPLGAFAASLDTVPERTAAAI